MWGGRGKVERLRIVVRGVEGVQRRKLGKTEEEVSLLGFGCMRLPTLPGGEVDEAEAVRIIRWGIDRGINYVDTAYNYHRGQSEVVLGRALRDGYRNKVFIADKLPVWMLESPKDCERIFQEQLGRLGVDQIDFYLLHTLNREFWHQAKKHKALEFLEIARERGLIKHVGFSFHDDLTAFKEIVRGYDWEFCQIQYNYMDEEYQAGRAGLEFAAARGLGVIVMEPLRGGRLVKNIPREVEEIFAAAPQKRTPAAFALRWVAAHPEVSLILSGMGALSEVEENLATLNSAQSNPLGPAEQAVIAAARDAFRERIEIMCTDCRYCLPCPEGVAIPEVFTIFNDASIYNSHEAVRWQYENLLKNARDGGRCVACGQCEQVCPQQLDIIATLERAHKAFV